MNVIARYYRYNRWNMRKNNPWGRNSESCWHVEFGWGNQQNSVHPEQIYFPQKIACRQLPTAEGFKAKGCEKTSTSDTRYGQLGFNIAPIDFTTHRIHPPQASQSKQLKTWWREELSSDPALTCPQFGATLPEV